MSRLDKLALTEFVPAFFFSLGAFVVLVILAGVMKPLIDILVKYGVGLDVLLKYFLLAMPQWIVYTFPMSVLMGTMLAVSRLSTNFEIVALKAAGVSLYRLTLPFLVSAGILCAVTFLLNEKVSPFTNRKLQELEVDLASGKEGKVEEQMVTLRLVRGGKISYVLFADSLKGNSLRGIKLFYFDPETEEKDWYLRAEKGTWSGDRWKFINGTIYNWQKDGSVISTKFSSTTAEEFAMTPREIAKRSRDPSELSISELREIIRYQEREKVPRSYILRFRVDYFYKFSIPLSPLFFVLIAVPLAIMPVRTSTAVGMGFSIVILLLYVFLMIISTQAGRGGLIPPALAAWIPNLSIFVIGVVLLWVKNR